MNHDAFEHAPHLAKFIFATVATGISAETLAQFDAIAAIFAHVATGLAATTTAIYTAVWIFRGRRKPEA